MNDNYNLFAAILSSYTICEIAELLPDTDLVHDLRLLANIQYEVLHHLRENETFDPTEMSTYMDFIGDKLKELDRIKHEKKKLYRNFSYEEAAQKREPSPMEGNGSDG